MHKARVLTEPVIAVAHESVVSVVSWKCTYLLMPQWVFTIVWDMWWAEQRETATEKPCLRLGLHRASYLQERGDTFFKRDERLRVDAKDTEKRSSSCTDHSIRTHTIRAWPITSPTFTTSLAIHSLICLSSSSLQQIVHPLDPRTPRIFCFS